MCRMHHAIVTTRTFSSITARTIAISGQSTEKPLPSEINLQETAVVPAVMLDKADMVRMATMHVAPQPELQNSYMQMQQI